ncbi:hypothetical protein [Bradyrhizobium sp. SZCCHNS1054]|uniref:hypothetical protein n=1 Tax=Bradyrhizobium sp. SZCCHNS1054 TaxID=3057301 RepID=UPI002916A3A8|nr:hypothetical protein [Bradyrhizobium sp. SZCCHNS1054]
MDLPAERNAAEFMISRLKSHVAKLRLRGHPGDLSGPSEWLDLCEAISNTSLEYLRRFDAASGGDRPQILKDTNDLNNLVYSLLVEMEGSGTEDLPYPVVGPMQRWIELLEIPNVTFFRALPAPIYEIRRFQLSDFQGIRNGSLDLKRVLSAESKWPYLRITVPSRALGILPHFAIVAHEVGHIIHQRLAPQFDFSDAELLKFSEKVLSSLGKAGIRSESKTFFDVTVKSWLAELFADAVGICMLGPAFYFALCAFIQGKTSEYILTRTHPPAILRRKIAFGNLTQAGKWDHPSVFTKRTEVELNEGINSRLLERPPATDALIESLVAKDYDDEEAHILCLLPELVESVHEEVFQAAYDHIAKVAPSLLYTSQQLDRDLEEHLEALVMAIPPIEFGASLEATTPAELSSILNVGWAVLLTRLDRLAVRQEENQLLIAEKSEKLHSLLVKAVELSEAKRIWGRA